jgi:hypothetical protein
MDEGMYRKLQQQITLGVNTALRFTPYAQVWLTYRYVNQDRYMPRYQAFGLTEMEAQTVQLHVDELIEREYHRD